MDEEIFEGKYVNRDTGNVKEYVDDNVSILNERIDGEVRTLNDKINTEVTRLDNRINQTNTDILDHVTNINNRIDREVDDLNETIVSEVNTINNRITEEISNIGGNFTEEVNRLDTRISTTNENLTKEVTRLDGRIDTLDTKVDNHITESNTKFENVNKDISNTNTSLNEHIASANKKFKDIDDVLASLGAGPSNEISRINGELAKINKRIDDTNTNLTNNVNTINKSISDNVNTLNTSIKNLQTNIENGTVVAGVAKKVSNSIMIQLNGGTTEGTNQFTFDGSAAKSINITPSSIGAATASHGTHLTLGETSSNAYRGDRGKTAYNHSQSAHAPSNAQKNSDITKAEIEAKLTGTITSHTHDYLPLSGGTVTGDTTFNKYVKLNAWTNYGSGAANFWYDGTNKTVEIETATDLKLAGTKVSKEGHTHNYLPLAGGTLTGATIFNDYLKLNAWSGYGSGTADLWYDGTNKTVEIETATDLKLNGTKVSKSGHTHNYAGSSSAGGTANSAARVDLSRLTGSSNSANYVPGANRLVVREYGSDCSNMPSAHFYHIYTGQGNDANYNTQLAVGMTTAALYYRNRNNGTWGSWTKVATSDHNHDSTYLKLSGGTLTGATTFNNYLKLNAWSGHGSGTANFWYDGTNKVVEIETATDLKLNGTKVSKEGHTHNYDSTYLKLSGGTLTGETTFNNYLKLNAWYGYGSGTANIWYDGTNKTVEIETATDLKLNGTKVSKSGHNHDSAYLKLSGGTVTGTSTFSGTLNLTGNVNLGGNGGNLYFANNKGIAVKNTGGTDRWVLYMDTGNRMIIGDTNQATRLQGSSISLSGTSAIVLNLTDTSAKVGYDSGTGDTYISNKNGNWLRMRADGTASVAGKQVVTFSSGDATHKHIRYGSGLSGESGYITFTW